MKPRLLFPCHPLEPSQPDPSFEAEVTAARSVGFDVGFVDMELYFGAQPRLYGVPQDGGDILYRGWIVTPKDYQRMETSLKARNARLMTNVQAYLQCYHFPNWYEAIGGDRATAKTIWFPGPDWDIGGIAAQIYHVFGQGALVIKDFVKSRKHEWYDACFIHSAQDETEVRRVIGNFIRLQGNDLVGGLVIREYLQLKRTGLHPKSRLPLVNEHRMFVYDKRVIYQAPYWSEGQSVGTVPDSAVLAHLLDHVESPFYTADVAEKEDGTWVVVELNDGGAAGIPEGGSPEAFYLSLPAQEENRI